MSTAWRRSAPILALLPLLFVVRAQNGKESFNVYTQRVNDQRTGVNLVEKGLSQSTVTTRFGKLWTLYSDAKVMAQPLYVSNLVSAKCPHGCNTVIFASMNDTVYAYIADQKPTSSNDTLIWSKSLGPPRSGAHDIDEAALDDPTWGILSTPAIDVANNLIYVVAWNSDQMYRVYALDLRTGEIAKGPVVIEGSVADSSFTQNGKNWRQLRKQRAGLLLDHGSLYIAFGGDNSGGIAGWLFVYDAATLQLRTVWSPEPGGKSGGIWMSGTGPVADQAGDIYLQTGNGDYDPKRNQYGDSLIKLKLEGNELKVVDAFTPCNQSYLNHEDLDMGSAAPLLLPGNLLLSGGKYGNLYLMGRDHLAGYISGGWHKETCSESNGVLQVVAVNRGHIHGSPLYWNGPGGNQWVYVMAEAKNLEAFPLVDERLKTGTAEVKMSAWKPPRQAPPICHKPARNWMPGGILALSSDGNRPGTGIVWALVPANGDSNTFRGVKGMLLALNAEDVSQELWRSQGSDAEIDTGDSLGLLARFVPPTVANGKVFIANAGDREELKRYCNTRPTQFPEHYGVVVYGLKN
ncbi:MAG TPA: hypothetical protein VHN10_11395 [Candidatus Acidoferrales bacterium]|jgi:hypothetical protein|nr:hypothetical protein [Candidatus Acidoferrales bacterium]